ncbi:MAG: hypothetical protein GY820_06710 [Gammaproteobacteria bacterium]|nr:hypothetical protein [Gammaproteobacteria bacterium]
MGTFLPPSAPSASSWGIGQSQRNLDKNVSWICTGCPGENSASLTNRPSSGTAPTALMKSTKLTRLLLILGHGDFLVLRWMRFSTQRDFIAYADFLFLPACAYCNYIKIP